MKDEYKSEENKTNPLINKFNDMLKSGTSLYFDSYEIEKIIDYFNQKIDSFKVKQAFNLYEKLYPFSSQISIKKAQTLILHDRPKEAFKLLNKLPENCDNEEYLYTKACIYSKLEEHFKAIEIFEKLLYLDNNNEEILSNLANEYQKINNYTKSAEMLEKLINLKTYNEINWYSYIMTCEMTDSLKQSLNFTKKYIDKNPFDYESWFYLGVIYQKMDDHINAIDSFDYSICIKEDYLCAYINKASSFSELGYYQQAIDSYKETFRYESPDAILYFDIAELYEKIYDIDNAKSYLYKCIKKDENFAEAWFSLSLIFDLQGLNSKASYHINKAIEINPNNEDYLSTYAKINEKIGLNKEAEIAYKKVLEINELDHQSWLDYSILLSKDESVNEAIEVLKKVVIMNPKNAELLYVLSIYLFKSGNEHQAISIFKKALSINYDIHTTFFKYIPNYKKNKNLLKLLKEH